MLFEAAIRAQHRVLSFVAALLLAVGCSKSPGTTGKEAKAKSQPAQQSAEQKDLMQWAALGPLPSGPVAVVGGKEIGLDAFRAIYDLKLARHAKKGHKLPRRVDQRHRSSITRRLIEQELLRREAEALGIEIDEKTLSETMQRMRDRSRDWKKDLERRAESDASLRQIEIAKMREQAILEKTVDLGILAKEIDEEYERVKQSYDKNTDRLKAARIVFEVRHGDDKAPALAMAREVRAMALKPGADFIALGKEHSTSPLTGEMGIMRADRMGKRFAEAFAGFEDGQITEPLETETGYELLKLIKRYPPGPLPKEALESQLATSLAGRKKLEEGRKLLERLAHKYGVQDNMAKFLGK
jgi:parvulin-like peptidyl-prolyl isomerase